MFDHAGYPPRAIAYSGLPDPLLSRSPSLWLEISPCTLGQILPTLHTENSDNISLNSGKTTLRKLTAKSYITIAISNSEEIWSRSFVISTHAQSKPHDL